MCGILGFSKNAFKAQDEKHKLNAALGVLSSRGPDNSGILELASCVLAHTRLSIIDLSEHANQPMSGAGLHIVFNGEIYNYKELAAELKMQALNDTSVLLALYKKYKNSPEIMLKKLNGMFAFVIYDGRDDSYFGARDRYGKKPLYYYKSASDASFIFSSRIGAILKLLDFTPRPNLGALSGYLSFMSPLKSQSFYEDIYKLPAGSYFSYKNGDLRLSPWLDLADFTPCDDDFSAAQAKVYDKLLNSLHLRLRSDVPLCFLLSGGLDSSTLCALYAREFGGDFDTFSLGFSEYLGYDESEFAQIAAKFVGSKHHQITLEKSDFFDILGHFYDFVDEPLADSATIPTYHLARSIHKNGFKVALSGEGSDECFLGYDLYFRVMEFYLNNLNKQDYPQISKDYEYLRRKELALPIYASAGEVFTAWQKEHLLNADIWQNESLKNANIAFDLRASCFKEPLISYKNKLKTTQEMSYMDFNIWISEVLSSKIDRASMAHSLEIRSPFLDPHLSSYALSLKDSTRSPNNAPKELLKTLVHSKKLLPDEIIYRKKKGFSSPFIEWVFSELDVTNEILRANKILGFRLFNKDFVTILADKAKSGRFKQHLWTLLHFSLWLKKNYA